MYLLPTLICQKFVPIPNPLDQYLAIEKNYLPNLMDFQVKTTQK